MTYRGIIFDLDGTLLNSLEGIAVAMNTLLEKLHCPTHSTEAYKMFVGGGITELIVRALPQAITVHYHITHLVTEFRTLYDGIWQQKSNPFPEIPGLLDMLSNRNISLSILSNKSDDFTKRMVAQLLPSWSFAAVLGARPGIPVKPDPAAALEISQITGIPTQEFMFIGDSGVDMETATAAGMLPVGVLWGFRSREELLANGAKILLENPMDANLKEALGS